MSFKLKILAATIGAASLLASTANATQYTIFDGIADGSAEFDSIVTATGETVTVDTWTSIGSGTTIDRGDYTIDRNNGGSISPTTYGTMSGQVIDISPSGGGSNPRTDPLDYIGSGVTLTFGTAVNAVGFEVGDWATCCFDPVTELFISFDGGAPIKVASADESSDGVFPRQTGTGTAYEIFVGAFDDSGDFNSVTFWGNGIGEYLVFGGEVRYALLGKGTLPPTTPAVPLPAAGFLMVGGLSALGLMRRRKAAKKAA